jgi:hypothetical protein
MLSASQREYIGKMIRTMQIIVLALSFGAFAFLIVATVVTPEGQPAGQERKLLLSYIAIPFTVAVLAAWLAVPRMIAGRFRNSMAAGKHVETAPIGPDVTDEQRQVHPFLAVYTTKLIIACALLEGAAFFNIVSYFLERQSWNLLIGLVMLLMILAHFPTASRVSSWVEDELREIDRVRSMGGL